MEEAFYPAFSSALDLGGLYVGKVEFAQMFLVNLPERVNFLSKSMRGNLKEFQQATAKLLQAEMDNLIKSILSNALNAAQKPLAPDTMTKMKTQEVKRYIDPKLKVRYTQIKPKFKLKGNLGAWFNLIINGFKAGTYVSYSIASDAAMKVTLAFPPQIDSVSPTEISPDGGDVKVTIYGKNFSPIPQADGGLILPFVEFTDANGSTFTIQNPDSISGDGKSMTLTILDYQIRDKHEFLSIKVYHPQHNDSFFAEIKRAISLNSNKNPPQANLGSCGAGIDLSRLNCKYSAGKDGSWHEMICSTSKYGHYGGEISLFPAANFQWKDKHLEKARVRNPDKLCQIVSYETNGGEKQKHLSAIQKNIVERWTWYNQESLSSIPGSYIRKNIHHPDREDLRVNCVNQASLGGYYDKNATGVYEQICTCNQYGYIRGQECSKGPYCYSSSDRSRNCRLSCGSCPIERPPFESMAPKMPFPEEKFQFDKQSCRFKDSCVRIEACTRDDCYKEEDFEHIVW